MFLYYYRLMMSEYFHCESNVATILSHYYHLANNLRLFGISDAKPTDPIMIIVGDPTSIILLNPYVYLAFIIDIWISIELIVCAFFRKR
ncbi:hypothetical protein THRCLA_21779, partial [Thraustotheca clavata]